jgi:hypothetical protein
MAARKKAAGARPASTQLMREALLRSLQREQGKAPKGGQRLQLAADALVDRAIDGETAALRELFQRVDGKLSDAPSGGERRDLSGLRIRWLTEADEVPSEEPTPGCAKPSRP